MSINLAAAVPLVQAAGEVAEHGGGAEGHGPDLLIELPGILPDITGTVVTMWWLMGLIILGGLLVARILQGVPRSRVQVAVEILVEGLWSLFAGVFDSREKAKQWLPFLGSFFIFILISNYSGLFPGAGLFAWFKPPTSHWGVTAGLALVVFVTVQGSGIKKRGLKHFKHFFEPLYLAPLMFPLGILEELVKPFSLSLRLFANIFGGEAVLAGLLASLPLFLPVTVLLLEIIFGFVQAFIFTLLATVYIASATAEHHH